MTKRRIYTAIGFVVEVVVVVLCMPVYLVLYLVGTPLIHLSEWFQQRRGVHLGLEVTHSPFRDITENFLVVDVSRVDQGLVGIRRRRWDARSTFRTGSPPPPYEETVEFIPIARFWVPEPFRFRDRRAA